MSLPQTPELARLIVTTIKAYAILVLTPQGEIVEWLGDAEAITGYAREEAVGRNFDLLFTESDLAADAARAEIAVALREGRAEDSRWHLHKEGRRFWANGMTLKLDGLAGAVRLIACGRSSPNSSRSKRSPPSRRPQPRRGNGEESVD